MRSMEATVDVVLWAIARQRPITSDDICTRWGVHKSTAWRWRDLLNDARDRAHGLYHRHRTPVQEADRERQPTSSPAAGMGGASFMKQDAVESSDSRNPVQVRERHRKGEAPTL